MLSDDDQALLDFEALPWRSAAAKEVAAHERFDVSATRYYQRLGALLDRQDAEEYAPQLVHRLRRMREARRRERSGRARA